MAERRFRCYNCDRPFGKEFTADGPSKQGPGPKCPGCGAEYPAVLLLEDVHWHQPDPQGPFAGADGVRRRVGCRPAAKSVAGLSATGEVSAVTCPACRSSAEFKAALDRHLTGDIDAEPPAMQPPPLAGMRDTSDLDAKHGGRP